MQSPSKEHFAPRPFCQSCLHTYFLGNEMSSSCVWALERRIAEVRPMPMPMPRASVLCQRRLFHGTAFALYCLQAHRPFVRRRSSAVLSPLPSHQSPLICLCTLAKWASLPLLQTNTRHPTTVLPIEKKEKEKKCKDNNNRQRPTFNVNVNRKVAIF